MYSQLSAIPRLNYVCVSFGLLYLLHEELGLMMQTHLGRLRNVGVVVVQGIERPYADIMRRRMMRSEPEDPLPRMYEELGGRAGPIAFCDDVDAFRLWRIAAVQRLKQHYKKMT